MSKRQLPKRIFVTWGGDGRDQFLSADVTPDSLEDGDTVGVYELRDVHTIKVTVTMRSQRKLTR